MAARIFPLFSLWMELQALQALVSGLTTPTPRGTICGGQWSSAFGDSELGRPRDGPPGRAGAPEWGVGSCHSPDVVAQLAGLLLIVPVPTFYLK